MANLINHNSGYLLLAFFVMTHTTFLLGKKLRPNRTTQIGQKNKIELKKFTCV